MWNPFKKKTAEQGAEQTSAPQAEKKKKESIEERIEREIEALPAMIKGKLKDPQIKQRFIDIAKRMEKDGVLRRVPDDVDRKIAYIEMTELAEARYEEVRRALYSFTGKCVDRFGEEKFDQVCALLDEFITIVEDEKKQCNK